VPLSVTSIQRHNGAGCDHITVTVNHEGVTRTFDTTFAEVDALIASLGGQVAAQKSLVMLWAAYRRAHGRGVLNVEFA
jgi:hypothetical protein